MANTVPRGLRDGRVTVTLRLRPETLEEVERLAELDERRRSEMLRIFLGEGMRAWKRKRGLE